MICWSSVIERGEHFRFTLQPREALTIRSEGVRQDFDRDRAPQICIDSTIHFAHTAGADLIGDLVWTQAGTLSKGHPADILRMDKPLRHSNVTVISATT